MKAGFVGLGKMGFSIVRHFLECGHEAVVFDVSQDAVTGLAEHGAQAAGSLRELVVELASPRIIWMMVPAGKPVDSTIGQFMELLEPGDVVVDGGNSHYTDSMRRAVELAESGVRFLDAGTSGGLEGARQGACVMIGGERSAFELVEPILKDICVDNGYAYLGSSGSGHYAKMVHNGIEYGMMQAMGEGFNLLSSSEFDFSLEEVARVWSNGSVIRGWLMELAVRAFNKDPKLDYLSGRIADSGEGRWTIEAALEQEVSIPVIAESLFSRYRSRSENNLSDRLVAALRHEFGGHAFSGKQ